MFCGFSMPISCAVCLHFLQYNDMTYVSLQTLYLLICWQLLSSLSLPLACIIVMNSICCHFQTFCMGVLCHCWNDPCPGCLFLCHIVYSLWTWLYFTVQKAAHLYHPPSCQHACFCSLAVCPWPVLLVFIYTTVKFAYKDDWRSSDWFPFFRAW